MSVFIVHFLHWLCLTSYFAATQNPFHQPFGGHFILFWQFTLGHSSGLIVNYIIQIFFNKYNKEPLLSSFQLTIKIPHSEASEREYLIMIHSIRESVTQDARFFGIFTYFICFQQCNSKESTIFINWFSLPQMSFSFIKTVNWKKWGRKYLKFKEKYQLFGCFYKISEMSVT